MNNWKSCRRKRIFSSSFPSLFLRFSLAFPQSKNYTHNNRKNCKWQKGFKKLNWGSLTNGVCQLLRQSFPRKAWKNIIFSSDFWDFPFSFFCCRRWIKFLSVRAAEKINWYKFYPPNKKLEDRTGTWYISRWVFLTVRSFKAFQNWWTKGKINSSHKEFSKRKISMKWRAFQSERKTLYGGISVAVYLFLWCALWKSVHSDEQRLSWQ